MIDERIKKSNQHGNAFFNEFNRQDLIEYIRWLQKQLAHSEIVIEKLIEEREQK